MSIINSKIIDFINEKENKIVLTIYDHMEWDNNNKHMYLLQEKINAYLVAIESGQLDKLYPPSKGKQIMINVILKYPPNEIGIIFFAKVKETLLHSGYNFEYSVFR